MDPSFNRGRATAGPGGGSQVAQQSQVNQKKGRTKNLKATLTMPDLPSSKKKTTKLGDKTKRPRARGVGKLHAVNEGGGEGQKRRRRKKTVVCPAGTTSHPKAKRPGDGRFCRKMPKKQAGGVCKNRWHPVVWGSLQRSGTAFQNFQR